MNLNKIKNLIFKIKYFLILCLKCNITFSSPPKKKIIIFDCESPESLHKLFSRNDVFILTTRVTKITELYLSIELLRFLFTNFFERPLRVNYLIYLIIKINPKVVITLIDNSTDFYIISKFLQKKIKFIALQSASRSVTWLPYKWTKKIFIPEFYTYGLFDKKIYLKKTSVKKIETKGSFQAACALTYLKKKKN